ncbi:hypothetical protein M422DRAFT_263986 [Sphaerobolus stellatus SS14]|uniref:Uncharacterized protein n=1 Tax=Sphaerobolus stellatus (strain SS14) TaxID=990650 RepID=A0A0C9TUK2_SPHS4|nr:hypothetical protein M422DRAFT_263986 [Sphaerobolus stellatus SS14]
MDLFNIDFLGLCSKEDRKIHLQRLRKELIPALWKCVPFVTDFFGVPEYDIFDENRFELDEFDMTHLILYDWHTGDDHLIDVGVLCQPINNIVNYIRSEKVRLQLAGCLIDREQALRALGRSEDSSSNMQNRNTVFCGMTHVLPNENYSDSESEDLQRAYSPESNASSSAGSDSLLISQEIYDDIADHAGTYIEYYGECRILSPCVPQQRFTIVPTQFNKISIADHVLNMVHEVAFDDFFETDFYICDFLREEILMRENEIPLTAVYTGDSLHGLWDNDWIQDHWENLSDDEMDDADINPLQLNPLQARVRGLAIMAHDRRISEYENGGPTNLLFPIKGALYQLLFTSHLIPFPARPKAHFHL